jgi:CMP/dCMP kinase
VTRSASRFVVAIDGPAGAGKSTVARELARRLGYTLVDTGALYRGVALAAKERGLAWDDGPALGALTASLQLSFVAVAADAEPRLLLDGRDVSGAIRTPEMAMGASDVSKHPEVRAALLQLQRNLGQQGGVVLEGRDIGTVVFPNARAKIFLTASEERRAERRVADMRSRGMAADYATTLDEIRARDAQDQNRSVAPLKPAQDSVVVDTSDMSFDQAVEALVELCKPRS